MSYLLTALAWSQAHPLVALGLTASILGTLANSLSHFPRAQAAVLKVTAGLVGLLSFVTDAMAIVANARGTGLVGPLTLPGVPTLPAKAQAMPTLLVLLALGLGAAGCPAGYWSQARKDAISADEKACALDAASAEWATFKSDGIRLLEQAFTDHDALAALEAFALDSLAGEKAAAEACANRLAADLAPNAFPADAPDAGTVVVASGSLRDAYPASFRESDLQRRARLWLAAHPTTR